MNIRQTLRYYHEHRAKYFLGKREAVSNPPDCFEIARHFFGQFDFNFSNSSVAILNLRSVALTLLAARRAADTMLKRKSKSRLVATEFRYLQLFEGQER